LIIANFIFNRTPYRHVGIVVWAYILLSVTVV